MKITAFNIPLAQYDLAKNAGMTCIVGGDPFEAAKVDLWHIPSCGVEDVPVEELPALERAACQLRSDTNTCIPVLVSSTYTRMLDYLGVEEIGDYYRAFAELAPSVTPILCHYPFHEFDGEPFRDEQIYEYELNLKMMKETFSDRGKPWWAFIQIISATHYGGDWVFFEVEPEDIEYQVWAVCGYGASGVSYFAWRGLDGPGIVGNDGNPSKYFDTIQAINKRLTEDGQEIATATK